MNRCRSFSWTILFFLLFNVLPGFSDVNQKKMLELKEQLVLKGVNETWFEQGLKDSRFVVYQQMGRLFYQMAERRVQRKEKDFQWYKAHFSLDDRAQRGRQFISRHQDLLDQVTARRGIDYELITAILGMETNFADQKHRGRFFTFCALVSQYLLMPEREKFAVNELSALYYFSKRSQKPIYYFIGSFAGACGWGQFIPSSLLNFFIDARGQNRDIDIYALDDNLFSIENYLYQHGLKKEFLENEKKLYQAVYAYNHSHSYVKAILYIYKKLKQKEREPLQ